MDMQNDYIKRYRSLGKIIPKIVEIIALCHERKVPVIHSLTINSKDPKRWPLIEELKKEEMCIEHTQGALEVQELQDKQDSYINKTRYSAFFETGLDRLLHSKNIETIILTGLLTHCCIYSTALDAYQRDYKVVFVKDAIASYRKELHNELMSGFFPNSIGEVTVTKKLLKRLEKSEHEVLEEIQW